MRQNRVYVDINLARCKNTNYMFLIQIGVLQWRNTARDELVQQNYVLNFTLEESIDAK